MRITGIGHGLLAIVSTALGILVMVYGNYLPLTELPLHWLARPDAWIRGLGAMLLGAGPALLFARTACTGAILIAAYDAVWLLARVVAFFSDPRGIDSGYGVCEALAPLLGLALLYPQLSCRAGRAPAASARDTAARAAFGATCIVFGWAHFAFAAYTASMVPSWLPFPLALAYLTGACHAAAGAGLLLNVLPRLASTLEALMMSAFGALVWVPSFFAHPPPEWATPAQNQWSETLVTFMLAASAWIVAASLRKRT